MRSELIKFKKLDPEAKIFVKQHYEDAGADVFALKDTKLEPQKITAIPTGLALEIPADYYGEFKSRSGLRKKGIWPPNNVLDSNYRGSMEVLLYNSTAKPYIIKKGERIAQFLIHPAYHLVFKEVQKLSNSERGKNGFGSSGQF